MSIVLMDNKWIFSHLDMFLEQWGLGIQVEFGPGIVFFDIFIGPLQLISSIEW
jgi:hypothetical protein